MITPEMHTILNKIKEYDRIMLFRHIRCDGDAVGATMGLREIIRLSYPEKEVYLIDDDHSEHLDFLGPEDPPVPDEKYRGALAIVLDTAIEPRISNKKYALCREIVKIDHHIATEPYGDYCWVEDHRSSTCEMIAEFYLAFRDELKINSAAATYIYTGMVTDSGRFRFSSVSGDTMRCAGAMLDVGINTDVLFAHLYLDEYESLKFKSFVYKNMRMTDNGVAYIYISEKTREKFDLTYEQASVAVSYLDSIKGCICWMAFIEDRTNSDAIRVRLRSRFVMINELASKYRGGGHIHACGATVYNKREVRALVSAADALVREYKATHDGWL